MSNSQSADAQHTDSSWQHSRVETFKPKSKVWAAIVFSIAVGFANYARAWSEGDSLDSFTIIVLAIIMLGAGLVYWLMARPKRHEQVTVRYNTLTCELRDYAIQMDLSVVRELVERCIVLERKSCWYYTIVDDEGDIILLFPIGYLQNEGQFKALLSHICRMEWTRIRKVQKGKDLWPEAYQKQKKGV